MRRLSFAESFTGSGGRIHRRNLRSKIFQLHKKYDKILFINLLTTGKLNEHVAEVDTRAQTMESMLVKQIAEQEGINETLKEEDQIEWVKRMNSIRSRVKEIIWNEIV